MRRGQAAPYHAHYADEELLIVLLEAIKADRAV